jgi:rRNA-processing protein FCF1
VGIIVVDSSALITLACAGALDLLALSEHTVRTVKEVYRETVEAGLVRGLPDAKAIQRVFDGGLVTIGEPRRTQRLAGISHTDSLVLRLAQEVSARYVLTNDQPLFRKAQRLSLPACFTAQFVCLPHVAGATTAARRDRLLDAFVAAGRYSEEFMRVFREGR